MPRLAAMWAAAVLALAIGQVSGHGSSAREVVRAIDNAVDRGRIDSVDAAWRSGAVPVRDPRTRRLALATVAAHRYRFADAARILLDLRRESLRDEVAYRAAFELARIELARGYTAAALPWLAHATREALLARDSLTLVEVMLSRASAVGNPTEVLALLDSATTIGSEREPHFMVAPLCRRGGLLSGMGQHRRAREFLHRGIARASATDLHRTEARCRLALMVSFINTGETDSVRVQSEVLSQLTRETGDFATLGSMLQWRATYLTRLGRPALARANLDTALNIGRLTRNDVIIAWSAFAMSDLDLTFGDAKGAYAWLKLSDSLMHARQDQYGLASIPTLYSRLAWLRGDYESVLRLTDSAVARARRDNPVAAQVAALEDHRRAALRMGRLPDASAALQAQRDLTIRHQLRGYEPSLLQAQAEIDLWNGEQERADSLLSAFAATLHPTQYGPRHDVLMYRAIGRLLAGDVARGERFARAAGGEYANWRASLTNPDDRKRAAQSAIAFGDPYGLPRVIAELAKRGRAATALELSEQRRAQHLRETLARGQDAPASVSEPLGVRQLQARIPDSETAVLEYVLGVGDAPSTLIVALRDTVQAFDLGKATGLATLVARFTARLEARQDAGYIARELGSRLMQPAWPILSRGIRRLAIVPDGPLNFVPFDALVLPNGRHVLDVFETAIVPSLTIAARWWQHRAPLRPELPSLVLGDPAYSSGARWPFGARSILSFLNAATPAFARLPGSAREARRVTELLGNSELALGPEASEVRLGQVGARDLRVLHIAGHAVVDDWSSDRSFIALAPAAGHDGIVTIDDLAALRLSATFVVLSACRTARGEVIGGEGVQSLAQPFLERGTRAVLATSWAVEDRHAFSLIDGFYRALARGVAAGPALRAAKLRLRRAGAAPSEWGAYVLLGDATLTIAPAL